MTKVNYFNQMNSILIKGNLFDLSKPKIMGILNATPDSFYSNSRINNLNEIMNKAEKMISEGADILDLGGISTKPNASLVNPEEEIRRILEPVKLLRRSFPNTIISLDTFNSSTAEAGLIEGVDIINDISGCVIDPNLAEIVTKYNAPYILTHSNGTPNNSSQKILSGKIMTEIIRYFSEKISFLNQKGINNIIIDPGFGFGKTIQQCFEIIENFEMLKILEKPILIGASRKSMIYKTLNSTPENSLNGTTAIHSFLIQKGASIFRVHDVEQMHEIRLLNESPGLFFKN